MSHYYRCMNKVIKKIPEKEAGNSQFMHMINDPGDDDWSHFYQLA